VDLDDTLFQTLRKCPADIEPERLVALGFARDGSPLSYATPRQMQLIDWLQQTVRLVPVTARSLDALRRVRIEFTAAVCAHGGIILDDAGAVDSAWSAHIGEQARHYARKLASLAEAVRRVAGAEPLSVRVMSEGGADLYVLVKHAAAVDAALYGVIDAMAGEVPVDWTIHRNGNNVAMMPPFLGKHHAVAALLPELRKRYPDAPVIGIGDSITDAPFMALCDFAMMPTGSQLAGGLARLGT
jgi:hypothetical protein